MSTEPHTTCEHGQHLGHDPRESATSLRCFLGDERQEDHDGYTAGLLVRRAAAMDRMDSRVDRAAAASDRARLRDHLVAKMRTGGAARRT